MLLLILFIGIGYLLYKCFKVAFAPLDKEEYKEPIITYSYNNITEVDKEDNSVVLKQDKFDVSRIKEYKGEEIKKFEFRPQTFEQFIGQEKAKDRAKTIIKGTKRGMISHFLVDGRKGHGKTTYVELIAKELNAKLIERVGRQVDEKDLENIINEINESKEKYIMFFIDEFETMDWRIIKILNPIIESFKTAGKRIKPFIFIGATINKYILLENNPDTLDRIPFHIKFERYNSKEIATILKQYKEQLFPDEKLTDEVIKIVSENCKFNPRTSIALLKEYIIEQKIDKVLNNCGIVKNGLNIIDIRILNALNNSKRAIGANALAMRVKLSQKEYITEFEPFLVEYDYINRVPSRVLTDKGRKILEEI